MSHKLILRDLSFSYGAESVLTHFSAEFTPGRPYAIVGRSGIGKTTLLRLIAGLIAPMSGEITGGGIENVSLAFQDHRLFPTLTALQNAAITSETATAREMLLTLGFTDEDMEKLPSALSGGMKQRVSLVRAFLFDAPVLLLDEPTASLDVETAEAVHRYICETAKKRIVILVSHDLQAVAAIDAIRISL